MNNFSEETNALLNKYLPNNDNSIVRHSNNAIMNTNEFIKGIDQKNLFSVNNNGNENHFNIVSDLKRSIDMNYEKFKGTYVPNENEISSKLFFMLSDIKNKIEEAENLFK